MLKNLTTKLLCWDRKARRVTQAFPQGWTSAGPVAQAQEKAAHRGGDAGRGLEAKVLVGRGSDPSIVL